MNTRNLLSVFAAAAVGVLMAGPGARAQSPAIPGWRLVWSDEFSGSTLNTGKWNAEDRAWPYNNELEYYLPQQATVSGGLLNIRAERRNFGGRNYVSARINTSGHFSQQYGRFEARIKVPIGAGFWPAFWLLPTSQAWPPEIDIMEAIGSQPSTVYMTQHWGTSSNVMSYGTTFTGPDFTAGYHQFAVEWSPTRVDWFVDGVQRFSTTSNFPQEPMYIILNLAIGGILPGPPIPQTVFPQSMLVDWVRAYMRDVPLANPSFENTGAPGVPASWQVFGNAAQSTIAPRTGTKSLRLSGIAGNGPYYAGAYQDLPASPGQVWTAAASGLQQSASRLVTGNFVDLKIEWYDHTGQQIGVSGTTALSAASAVDVPVPATVQATAPAGTAKARVALVLVQNGSSSGTAYFDDVTFAYSTPGAIQPCAGDFNGAGGVTVQDIFDFLAAYFVSDPRGDFNGQGGITVQDIFDFLAAYFAACSG